MERSIGKSTEKIRKKKQNQKCQQNMNQEVYQKYVNTGKRRRAENADYVGKERIQSTFLENTNIQGVGGKKRK